LVDCLQLISQAMRHLFLQPNAHQKLDKLKKTRRIGWVIETEEVAESVEPFGIAVRNATEAGQINNTLLGVQIEHNKTQFKNFSD
jgi:hypothetical protein